MSSLLDSNGAGFSSGTEPNNFTQKYLCIENFPPGFRFLPTDVELIHCYLQMKIEGKSLPYNKIHEVDLYKYRPETLAGMFEQCNENEWYFFTPRDRKYKNGSRPRRSCEDGYWKASGADRSITDNGQRIGSKRSLVFYNGKSPKTGKTNWIMHEYRFERPPRVREHENDMKLDDFVLCKIYERKPKKDPVDGEPEDHDQSHGRQDNEVEDRNESVQEPEPERPVTFGETSTSTLYFQHEEPDLFIPYPEIQQFDFTDCTLPFSCNDFPYIETTSQCPHLSSTDEMLNMIDDASPP